MARASYKAFISYVVALVAFATVAWIAWQQRTIAVSRALAASALVQVTRDPDLGQLLAVEAINTAATAQAEHALRETLIKAAVLEDFKRMRLDAARGAHAERFADQMTSPDGTVVLKATEHFGLQVIDSRTNGKLVTFGGHQGTIVSAAIRPDNKLVASVDESGAGRVWEARTGKEIFSVLAKERGNYFVGVVWSPDGRYLVTGGVDHTAQVRESGSWRLVSSFDMHQGAVDRIAVSPDNRYIVTGSTSELYGVPVDRRVHVWESRTGTQISEMTDDRRALEDVAFSADGTLVIAEYDDVTTRIWNAKTGAALTTQTAEQPGTAGFDGPVLTITAGAPNISGEGLYGIRNVLFSADGRLLTAVGEDGGASVWQIPLLALHERLSKFAGTPNGDAEGRSPDKHVAIELGSPATIVDRVHGNRRGELALPQPIIAAAFSPDGLRIAVADGSPDVRIYRWETFAPVEELIAMVRKRVARDLTPKERSEFVP